MLVFSFGLLFRNILECICRMVEQLGDVSALAPFETPGGNISNSAFFRGRSEGNRFHVMVVIKRALDPMTEVIFAYDLWLEMRCIQSDRLHGSISLIGRLIKRVGLHLANQLGTWGRADFLVGLLERQDP